MIKIMYGVDFAAIRPVDSVAKIKSQPILFIHGEADKTISVSHAYRLFNAAQNPLDQLWIVSGAGHTQAFKTQPEEYINKITEFFDLALKRSK
jgi:fermentation-respiration switch protein FrsA (DUF1100 family)